LSGRREWHQQQDGDPCAKAQRSQPVAAKQASLLGESRAVSLSPDHPAERAARLVGCGRALPGHELRIVDEDGGPGPSFVDLTRVAGANPRNAEARRDRAEAAAGIPARRGQVLEDLDAAADAYPRDPEVFDDPESFDITHFVHGDLGVARPTRARFMVEFDARVADDVRAKRLHPQQRIATAPDGRIRVSLPLVDARAAVTFVLSWGDAARVVEPPELATEVGNILARAASRYA
jgi:hypothetical protein